jgi:uncharacterized iron-regulated protein
MMKDNAVSTKYKLMSLAALLTGSALFGVSQWVGTSVQAHPHPHETEPAEVRTDPGTRVLEMSTLSNMDGLMEKLADRRVVFVGETHDRYDHHLNQLAVIKGMYAQNPKLAIGLEFFQQPFQEHIDRYVDGAIDEREFIRNTEYYNRWRYDYRLYRPILRFAREKGIPVIALNIPTELSKKVAREGLEGLDEKDKVHVPAQIDHSDEQYRQRIKKVFDHHPMEDDIQFDNFLAAQLLWDEAMAERAARYLADNPQMRMVVLAGTGHLEYGQGIPSRLLRRQPVASAIVLNQAHHALEPDLADFLLFPERIDLPRSGLLGVMLDVDGDGVTVKDFGDDSPAESAGLKAGDRILTIAGAPVQSYSDIRLTLMDRRPGEEVPVEVEREHMILGGERLSYRVKLH